MRRQGVSDFEIYRAALVEKGALPALHIGNVTVVERAAAVAYKKNRAGSAAPATRPSEKARRAEPAVHAWTSSRGGARARRPEHEHDVIEVSAVPGAANLGEHHRAELLPADRGCGAPRGTTGLKSTMTSPQSQSGSTQ